MIHVVNKESQNLHTEMLLRLVGLKVKGEGSAEGPRGGREIRSARRAPTQGWGLTDGSGFSRTDLLTRAVWSRSSWPWTAIPRPPFSATPSRSRAWTGRSRSGCAALPRSGRFSARPVPFARQRARRLRRPGPGERLAFAILVNNHTATPGRPWLRSTRWRRRSPRLAEAFGRLTRLWRFLQAGTSVWAALRRRFPGGLHAFHSRPRARITAARPHGVRARKPRRPPTRWCSASWSRTRRTSPRC